MNYPLFYFLLLPALAQANVQTGRRDSLAPSFSAYKQVIIKLEDPKKEHSGNTLFRHFEVLDERPDTSRIGIHTSTGFFGKVNRQLVLTGQGSRELGNYLDNRFAHSSSPYTALVVIRALWLSDATYTLADLSKDNGARLVKTKIRLRAEVYAEKAGVYTPLFRFDSTRMSWTAAYHLTGRNLAGMLNELADSATTLLGKKGTDGKQLALEDIRRFNKIRFNPVIYNDNDLIRGVYRDFQEFKDNAPSIHNFQTIKDQDKLLLYLKEPGGNTYYYRNAWGYCDGTTIYVMKEGLLLPAWKEGKAFYTVTRSIPMSGGHIFTVDMDSGKLY